MKTLAARFKTLSIGGHRLSPAPVRANIERVRQTLTEKGAESYPLLLKPNVLEWVFAEPEFIRSLTHETEKEWGLATLGRAKSTSQWTTLLGEGLLHEALLAAGHRPRKIAQRQRGASGHGLDPDRETDDGLWECKARTYHTSGTAGMKILGAPLHYCECPRLYGKPLHIVCMAYQEVEAKNAFQLFEPQSPELSAILHNFKTNYKIDYVPFTQMLMHLTSQ